ncbi:unnamed protein product [Prorocentrum cordatum]|uniref:Uncharacterized protein n=1 Tax=Prorocentrum cordatum TaxID=2364126 RepID=A0ABN9U4A3_9DINO|nr:unnamed protein product [Polarella glacialis]
MFAQAGLVRPLSGASARGELALGPQRRGLGDRSRSPELDDWLAQRTRAKLGDDAPLPTRSRQSRSVPPPKPISSPKREPDRAHDDSSISHPARPFVLEERDDRAWAEILADEQAQQDSIFEDINKEISHAA